MDNRTRSELSDSDAAGLAISRLEGRIDELCRKVSAVIDRADALITVAQKCFNQTMLVDQKVEEVARNVNSHEIRLASLEEWRDTVRSPPPSDAAE